MNTNLVPRLLNPASQTPRSENPGGRWSCDLLHDFMLGRGGQKPQKHEPKILKKWLDHSRCARCCINTTVYKAEACIFVILICDPALNMLMYLTVYFWQNLLSMLLFSKEGVRLGIATQVLN